MGMAPRASLDYEDPGTGAPSTPTSPRSSTGCARTSRTTPSSGGRPLFPYVGFDACSELEWDSLEAMDAFASEHYQRAVVADEHSLIDKSRFLLLLSERRVLQDGEPGRTP